MGKSGQNIISNLQYLNKTAMESYADYQQALSIFGEEIMHDAKKVRRSSPWYYTWIEAVEIVVRERQQES